MRHRRIGIASPERDALLSARVEMREFLDDLKAIEEAMEENDTSPLQRAAECALRGANKAAADYADAFGALAKAEK
jgi:hypothetical protein